ncbi:Na+/H+ antiporter subunit E [Thioalkalivibrio sp. ALJ7]|uniref:Na+/H+ antiporter subunit E n=1 Tax=Thioalkalivibrio sp. ALJ7 TaxID=1158756 RepID=UPI0004757EEC|nr:Na+/H+ antiporter subunit E [Thioalkalivibrio sp. ALJ7]
MTPTTRSGPTKTRFAGRTRSRSRRAVATVVGAAILWWILAGPEALLEPLALLAMLLAGGASLLLPVGRPLPLRPRAIPALLGFFLRSSFVGGLDVARRALHPRLPIEPAFVTYRSELAHGPPLTLFMAVVSLLPGTLSVRLEGRLLTLHVLDRNADTRSALIALEGRIRAAFRDPRKERGRHEEKNA